VVASLLFGGTLGLSAAASAGFVGTTVGSMLVTDAYVWLDVNNVGFQPGTLAGALAGGMAYDAAGSGGSVTLSPFTASGFSLSTTPVDGIWTVYGCVFTFTALSDMTIELSGQMDAQSAFVYVIDNTSSSLPFLRGTGDLGAWTSGEINLFAGRSYTLGVNGPATIANGSGEAGSILNFAVVPAPGALALLGVAGLAGARRRR
jgi:MYXO-CTERM domain-containing protein